MALLAHAERIVEVRFLLGDPTTTIISDTVIDRLLTRQEEYYGADLDSQCYVLYNTCLDCLIYLVKKDVAGSGGSGPTTALTKRREKVGSVEIEETYASSSSGSTSTVNSWESLYDYFKKHPESVCKSLKKNPTSGILIGGVVRSEKESIYEDPESFGAGYAENQEVLDYDFYDTNTDPYFYPQNNDTDLN